MIMDVKVYKNDEKQNETDNKFCFQVKKKSHTEQKVWLVYKELKQNETKTTIILYIKMNKIARKK